MLLWIEALALILLPSVHAHRAQFQDLHLLREDENPQEGLEMAALFRTRKVHIVSWSGCRFAQMQQTVTSLRVAFSILQLGNMPWL